MHGSVHGRQGPGGRAQRPRGLLGARPHSLYKRSYSSDSELVEEVWDSRDIMEGTATTS